MLKSVYNVIGVMSGTSLDGLDLAFMTFTKSNNWEFNIHNCQTITYTPSWREKLKNLVNLSKNQLLELDIDFTHYLAEQINLFISQNHIMEIDFVSSHGHTALHQPQQGITYQIGNLPILASLINHKVVCDFRVQDVELGGQGAPLVPIGDSLLFAEYDICLNLGGFANISMDIEQERIAYDICPANIVLNHYIAHRGKDFDDQGNFASTGNIHEELLMNLNAIDFYKTCYPKSLGLEWVQREIYPLVDSYNIPLENKLRTFVEHIAIQISREFNTEKNGSVLVTGGGVYNSFLIDRIKFHTTTELIFPQKSIIEFKETLIFGFLGVLKTQNEVNCLKTVTGASKNHSSGKIYYP